jgi:hypothetical protein
MSRRILRRRAAQASMQLTIAPPLEQRFTASEAEALRMAVEVQRRSDAAVLHHLRDAIHAIGHGMMTALWNCSGSAPRSGYRCRSVHVRVGQQFPNS